MLENTSEREIIVAPIGHTWRWSEKLAVIEGGRCDIPWLAQNFWRAGAKLQRVLATEEGISARLLVAATPCDMFKFGELVFTDFLFWKTFTVLHSVVSIQSVTTPWHNWLRGCAFPMSSMVFQKLDFWDRISHGYLKQHAPTKAISCLNARRGVCVV